MTPDQFQNYLHTANHESMARNDRCASEFGIGSYERWDYDLREGTLTFSNAAVPRLIAEIQVVGTTANSVGTWLWSWANRTIPLGLTRAALEVRAFGRAEKLALLTKSTSPADEYFGWEMTAIAAKRAAAIGSYRCPDDKGFMYVLLMSARFVTPSQSET
jgi:hypothetical protein